jgi:23S rRNA (cytosine1962-C5)-methyltransferase
MIGLSENLNAFQPARVILFIIICVTFVEAIFNNDLSLVNRLETTKIPDYQLVDCGDFEKLERFGPYYLIRPESQAIWKKKMSMAQWQKLAHAHFKREQQKVSYRSGEPGNGGWNFIRKMPDNWLMKCPLPQGNFSLKLSLTSFGHVGIFPEQIDNWNFIYTSIRESRVSSPRVLNAFAYTGGASLAARAAGAEVTHLDAVKQVVNWAKENMMLSKQYDIRWIVDDALKFLKREEKRGKTYHGLILDPPAYGRGPSGERWILDESINEVLNACTKLLEPQSSFFVLNLYSLGYSPLISKNLVESHFGSKKLIYGESYIRSETGIDLPLGTYVRFRNG